ncbi:condensation protein [Leptospira sp. 201903070]|uniref:Phthiocerol/phthiodiolone dimycocerosyl transferase n=1 Tax=Leptospira ainlahdjerensis TaxID=2810033 RepID=A0ABS2UGK5_9LEPT|nr:condensation protein [Leptospira ainlahdjerensis]MBM9579492.1 condensation protein [Leptospira ainlahdjerensis]
MQTRNNENSQENIQERLLDKAESTFWLLDRVSSMNFAVIAEGEGDLNPDLIRRALDIVQKKHPLANVQVELGNESGLMFKTVFEKKIPLKILDFENELWKNRLAHEVMIPFSEGECPLIRAVFFRSFSGNWILSIIFHHSIADGRSGLSFLIDVFKETENILDYSNIINQKCLPKSVLSLLKIEKENSDKPKISPPSEGPPVRIASLPSFSKKNRETNPVLTSFQLSESELEILLSLCKQKETTLHGIVGAAQLLALYSMFETTDPILLNLSNPADLKPNLSEKVPSETLGLYITLLTLGIFVRKDSNPWMIAKEISDGLRAQIRNGNNDVSFYGLIPAADQILSKPNGIKTLSALLQRFPQSSVLSNVGILPDLPKFQNFRVTNLSFTVHPSVSQSVFVSASTYQKKMTILLNYDSNRWTPDSFDLFKKNFMEILRELIIQTEY